MKIVRTPDGAYPLAVLRRFDDFGIVSADLVRPAGRFFADSPSLPPLVETAWDVRRLSTRPTPAAALAAPPRGETWTAASTRSIAALEAHFLVAEDPQRRLDAREVVTLAHQASLVRHVLDTPSLTRVLIGDEVGLGKTVEAGLIIKELLEATPGLRVLYLAPARLVRNVHRELERLGLPFRRWMVAGDANATDPKIVASIHRATHSSNFDEFVDSQPWDVIVVDECHHLSDWAAGGGDPKRQFTLVKKLIERQPPHGRVLLMSGTPHQGHPSRFENLVGLLRRDGEDASAISGRVIYRTKEDVQDWDGNPLFPRRQVRDPIVVDLGAGYRAWLDRIAAFYGSQREGGGEPARRAAGWRSAQALQWAASSIQAGLGYLVRQAIRAGWTVATAGLQDAICALRPYRPRRLAAARRDEPPAELFQRIRAEVERQMKAADIEDLEELDDSSWRPDPEELRRLLETGLSLLATPAAAAKFEQIWESSIATADGEKIVFFAQPIETVTAFATWLETSHGVRPALIIGGQTDAERDAEVRAFWDASGPRFLVSSRAGGEGLNLQVARRLIHMDVPWNPMDMEQRVGRVHRFLSRKTILVDTVVAKGSREADAYAAARRKLELIASTLVAPERFEGLFSRIMTLIPPQSLQEVYLAGPPSRHIDQEAIAALVREGFDRWRGFHDRFGAQQRALRDVDAGLARWEDLRSLLIGHAKAEVLPGFAAQRFEWSADRNEVVALESAAEVIRLPDGRAYLAQEYSGLPVMGPGGERVEPLGLNTAAVAPLLRALVFGRADGGQDPTGAAFLRWAPAGRPEFIGPAECAVLAMVRVTVRNVPQRPPTEHAVGLHFRVFDGGSLTAVTGTDRAVLVRSLRGAVVRRDVAPEESGAWAARLQPVEDQLAEELRRPSDTELAAGIRHAVFPVLAAVVSKPG